MQIQVMYANINLVNFPHVLAMLFPCVLLRLSAYDNIFVLCVCI